MKKQTKFKNNIVEVLEAIWYILSFSFELIFKSKTLKIMWLILVVATWLYIGNLRSALLFISAFAIIMIIISSIMIIGFEYILSRNRDYL